MLKVIESITRSDYVTRAATAAGTGITVEFICYEATVYLAYAWSATAGSGGGAPPVLSIEQSYVT